MVLFFFCLQCNKRIEWYEYEKHEGHGVCTVVSNEPQKYKIDSKNIDYTPPPAEDKP